jgi:hypothetical protein
LNNRIEVLEEKIAKYDSILPVSEFNRAASLAKAELPSARAVSTVSQGRAIRLNEHDLHASPRDEEEEEGANGIALSDLDKEQKDFFGKLP